MALINKSEIGREDGQILVPVGQAFECDRDANSIPELRERHPSDSGKDAADVEARVTEHLGQVPEVRVRWVRDDRLASLLDDAAVVGQRCRTAGAQASRSRAFGKGTDELGDPLVEFETVDAPT
jgi:hypothetical protein